MSIELAASIQREACIQALTARLEAEGLAMPSCFRVDPTGMDHMNVEFGSNAHCPGDPFVQLRNAWDSTRPERVSTGTLDALQAAAHVSHRRWAQSHRPEKLPSWAVLVHPLLLAVLLYHEPDRRRMPLKSLDHRKIPLRWDVEDGETVHAGRHGNASVDAWYAKGLIQCSRAGVLMPLPGGGLGAITVESIPHPSSPDIGSHRIMLPGVLPHTLLEQIRGRRLGDVIGLPPTGYDDVDAAAADCPIVDFETAPAGYRIAVGPARLMPYGTPPPEHARAMSLAPVFG